jgi:hypothetical protein
VMCEPEDALIMVSRNLAKMLETAEQPEQPGISSSVADTDEPDDESPETLPTHGRSTLSNPLGRIQHDRSLFRVSGRELEVVGYETCVHNEICPLCFYAPAVTFAIGPVALPASSSGNSARSILEDPRGRTCGFISAPDTESLSDRLVSDATLIMLLITSYRDFSMHHAASWTSCIYETFGVDDTLEDYLETLPEDGNSFDFCKCYLHSIYRQRSRNSHEVWYEKDWCMR